MPIAFILEITGCFRGWTGLLFPEDFVTSAYMPQQCFSAIRQMAAQARLTVANRRRD